MTTRETIYGYELAVIDAQLRAVLDYAGSVRAARYVTDQIHRGRLNGQVIGLHDGIQDGCLFGHLIKGMGIEASRRRRYFEVLRFKAHEATPEEYRLLMIKDSEETWAVYPPSDEQEFSFSYIERAIYPIRHETPYENLMVAHIVAEIYRWIKEREENDY